MISSISPNGSGAYSDSSATNSMLKWAAGDMLSFSAAGDTVHTFTGTVKAPDDIAGINPAFSDTLPTTVSEGSDWVVTWTAGSAPSDGTELVLTARNGISADGTITCDAKDSDAMVTVHKALLLKINATDNGSVSLTRSAMDMPSDDNASVTISANTIATGLVKFAP